MEVQVPGTRTVYSKDATNPGIFQLGQNNICKLDDKANLSTVTHVNMTRKGRKEGRQTSTPSVESQRRRQVPPQQRNEQFTTEEGSEIPDE